MSESGLDIQKRAVSKSTQKYKTVSGEITEHPRYVLNLPKEFVERHNLKEKGLWLVADQVWFGLPDEASLLKVVALLPEIKQMVGGGKLSEEDIQKLVAANPEIKEFLMKEFENNNTKEET